jgi:hypothetical protein
MLKFSMLACAAGVAAAVDNDATIFDLRDAIGSAQTDVADLEAKLASGGDTAVAAFRQTIDQLMPSLNRIQELVSEIDEADAKVQEIKKDTETSITDQGKAIDDAVDKVKSDITEKLNEAAEDLLGTVNSRLNEVIKGNSDLIDEYSDAVDKIKTEVGSIATGLATTHFNDPKAPVFRYNIWHCYQNGPVGWYQGNNPAPFGNRHPSQWGDDNTWAHDMHPEIKYLKRLFNKEMYGSSDGITVCAESFHMCHSTDDKRCGAITRIRNTKSSNVNIRINWTFSGWCGWGNRASTALNKGNVWGGCCHGICTRDDNYNIVGGKINTLAWVAGGSHPYGHYNHFRTTMLSFNNFNLPDGLEFVDDLDTATGTWRV